MNTSTITGLSPASALLIETLVVGAVYGAVCWRLIWVPLRRHRDEQVARRPVLTVVAGGATIRTPTIVAARHLTLVRSAG